MLLANYFTTFHSLLCVSFANYVINE